MNQSMFHIQYLLSIFRNLSILVQRLLQLGTMAEHCLLGQTIDSELGCNKLYQCVSATININHIQISLAMTKILLALICLIMGASAVGYCEGGWCTACSSDFVCTSCTSDSYLANGKCIPCPMGCATCDATGCLTCSNGAATINNQCLQCTGGCNACNLTPKNCTTCRDLLVINSTAHTCAVGADCADKNCVTCNDKTSNATMGKFCEACTQNYYVYGGTCRLCPYPALTCNLDPATMFSTNVQNLITSYVQSVSGDPSAVVDYSGFTHYWQKQNLFQFNLIDRIIGANNLTMNPTTLLSNLTALNMFGSTTVVSRRLTDAEKVGLYSTAGVTTAAELNLRMINQVKAELTHVTCMDGFFISGSKCTKCLLGCKACSDSTTCTQCFVEFTLATNDCTRVTAPCLTSVGTGTNCTSCAPPYVLGSGNTCVMCTVPNCQTCSTASQCTTCMRPYSKLPNSNNTCYTCAQSSCLHCNPVNTTTCIECTVGNVLTGNTCSSCPNNCSYCTYDGNTTTTTCRDCQSGYALVNGACTACGLGCLHCSPFDTSVCMHCRNQMYKDESGVCQKCQEGCAICSQYEGICTKLLPGFSFLNGNIRRCQPGCKVCDSANPLTCLQCMDGGYLATGKCQRCSNGCNVCTSGSVCTICAPNFYLVGAQCKRCTGNCLTCGSANDTDLGNCLSCRQGFRLDATTNKCTAACGRGCIECSSSGCTKCANGFGLKADGTCVKCLHGCSGSCTATDITQCSGCGYGFEKNTAGCTRCPDGCLTCLSSQCTSCLSGFALTQADNGFTCQLGCNFPCSTCTASGCTVCATGYNLTNSVCIFDTNACTNNLDCSVSCPLGSFSGSNTCTACSAGCSACSNASSCTQCFDGYRLSGASCVACPSECRTCSEDGTCTTCGNGYTQEIVSPNNSPTSAVVSPTCTACNSRCKTCAAGSNYCLSCADGYRLRDSQCFGRNNAGFTFKFDKALSDFLSSASSQTITAKIASILGISQDDIIINSITSGSTIFSGSVSADSNTQAIGLANTLYDAVKANNGALGLTATDYTVGAYYDDTQVSNSANFRNIAGIIIGCSIAVGALIIIILVVVCVIRKMKGTKGQGDNMQNDKEIENREYARQVAQYDYALPADGPIRQEHPTVHELRNYQ